MRCQGTPTVPGAPPWFEPVLATSPRDLVMICGVGPEDKTSAIASSTDGGTHFSFARLPRPLGDEILDAHVAVAAGQTRTMLFAWPDKFDTYRQRPARDASIRSVLERTTNGGRSWTRITASKDGGAGFGDLQFVSRRDAWVIHGSPGTQVDQLLRSTDAGASFAPIRF